MGLRTVLRGTTSGGLRGVFGSYTPYVPTPTIPSPGSYLSKPPNLFTAAQSAFDETSNINLRSNWEVVGGQLLPLGNSTNDARIDLDTPVTVGDAHVVVADVDRTAGNLKLQLGGSGTSDAYNLNADWQAFNYITKEDMTSAYTRMAPKPTVDFAGSVDNVAVYNLSTVDPTVVPCDVLIIGGDSNTSNSTSEFVTAANRESPFDPRISYLPCLRASSTFNNTGSTRHIPQPMFEPVQSAGGAARMSPCHAAATELVEYSAARGRPLLVMALGDAGSGLRNTEDWVKGSAVSSTGGRMWDEMVAMKAIVDGLGPSHEIIGAIWSIGANDRFAGADADAFDVAHTATYNDFFSNVRSDIADVPMVLINIGQHIVDWFTTENDNPGFGPAMQTWLNRFDEASGHANAITDLKVVEPPVGNSLGTLPSNDPHFNAVGIQANGRLAGTTLLGMLQS